MLLFVVLFSEAVYFFNVVFSSVTANKALLCCSLFEVGKDADICSNGVMFYVIRTAEFDNLEKQSSVILKGLAKCSLLSHSHATQV